ncbi:Conidiation-specific protein 13 [Mycena indigotica]|uniref:Conidiation-specific protein 13 n=1 Tax=Mycena indigotica TaxID=2126181 RepID=A0A8H6T7U9_9AGAR|nr:Conidiation-specific protein 13 [Mycena indigotica]KAF7311816.1 Conidiation-specific protein 13 [Mycena indigotica]
MLLLLLSLVELARCQATTPLSLAPQQADLGSFDLANSLPPPAYSVHATTLAQLPPECAAVTPSTTLPSDIGNFSASCSAEMTALSVTLEDCDTPYIICRCADAEMAMDALVDRLARVPVGLRRYAGTVIALAATVPGPSAVTMSGASGGASATFCFGDCTMNVWIHEMTHALDMADPGSAGWQSSAIGWSNALAADTCVPDTYSQTNAIEDFAQVSVLLIYKLLNGGLPPGFYEDCMKHQLAYLSAMTPYNDSSLLFGNDCSIGPLATHSSPPDVLDPTRQFNSSGEGAAPDPPSKALGSGACRPATSTTMVLFLQLGGNCLLVSNINKLHLDIRSTLDK